MSEERRKVERRRRFVDSSRWQGDESIKQSLVQKCLSLSIVRDNEMFLLEVNGQRGQKRFPNLNEAKIFAFNGIESGTIEEYVRKRERLSQR